MKIVTDSMLVALIAELEALPQDTRDQIIVALLDLLTSVKSSCFKTDIKLSA